MNKNNRICIIGLGYVGLPLAVEFGKKRDVVGFDINQNRVKELNSGNDFTLEITSKELKSAIYLSCTSNIEDIKDCKIYIITVPTPLKKNNVPDLSFLKDASAN